MSQVNPHKINTVQPIKPKQSETVPQMLYRNAVAYKQWKLQQQADALDNPAQNQPSSEQAIEVKTEV